MWQHIPLLYCSFGGDDSVPMKLHQQIPMKWLGIQINFGMCFRIHHIDNTNNQFRYEKGDFCYTNHNPWTYTLTLYLCTWAMWFWTNISFSGNDGRTNSEKRKGVSVGSCVNTSNWISVKYWRTTSLEFVIHSFAEVDKGFLLELLKQQSRNTLTLGRPEVGIPDKEMCGHGFMWYNDQS